MKPPIQPQPFIATPALKRRGWLIHLIGWGILMGIPFLFTTQDSPRIPTDKYLHFLTVICSYIVLFYANYACFVRRFLFTRRIVWFLFANLLLILALMVAVHYVHEWIAAVFSPPQQMRSRPPEMPIGRMHVVFTLASFCTYWLMTALSVAFKMTGNWYAMEAERRELERSRSEAELQNLKSQLNPHFLFNTLNNIYSLIAFSPEKAQEAVHELSRMLRYVMYDSNRSLVPLEKDLDFVKNYVELMRIRLPQHVELQTDISSEPAGSTLIAPLLFISLIENAFKHGVSNHKPSFIHIRIHREDNRVVCTILNSDFHKAAEQDMSGSGIGLANLQRRLSLLYPGRYTFECGTEGENYRSSLSLTINESAV